MKYYTKVKINNDLFYFDDLKDLHDCMDLYFWANKNHKYIEIALSNKEEFKRNVEE